ncbi:hypothetical protein diail_9868 [Diaporthe ilicicola]|nr:hypothetical protein diail_9868 [Diaporthe ilicicola]
MPPSLSQQLGRDQLDDGTYGRMRAVHGGIAPSRTTAKVQLIEWFERLMMRGSAVLKAPLNTNLARSNFNVELEAPRIHFLRSLGAANGLVSFSRELHHDQQLPVSYLRRYAGLADGSSHMVRDMSGARRHDRGGRRGKTAEAVEGTPGLYRARA